MSEQGTWNNDQADGVSGGTRSSQEILCKLENVSEFDGNHQNARGDEPFQNGDQNASMFTLPSPQAEDAVYIAEESNAAGDANVPNTFATSLFDPALLDIDEETRMTFEGNSVLESPRVTSPCDQGDVSSPFEAMESDGLDLDDSIYQASGATRRAFPSWQAAQSTTTPGASSDDDPYSSNCGRKKRRKTKRYMNFYDNVSRVPMSASGLTSPFSSQIPSPSPSADAGANETEDSSVPTAGLGYRPSLSYSASFNNSDSNLHISMTSSRRLSNASESSQNASMSKDAFAPAFDSKCENSAGQSCEQLKHSSNRRRTHHHHRSSATINSEMALATQHPSNAYGCSLEIVVQPEQQHRARYLTEGSRGPVKDSSQQAYPQLQLKGYTTKTTLNIYVGSESEDKIRPHGFYQACKVTGRNTTPCEETEIDGTKVIQIPFDTQECISVDCVGILKLRNADVEARIGVSRAKKRNQVVKLVFRVVLEDVPNAPNPLILQVASNRISCTQPPGQPEITKKSMDRCPVEGGSEMFIIGRNFHKGTKVIFQDPEEADGSHWHTNGQLDKDTFNQTHMVVRVPPYHDQNITKPVSVQVLVEHNDRKCDPHSFTYDPNPKSKAAAVLTTKSEEDVVKQEPDNPLKTLFGGNIDRKLLEALFAKLLTNSEKEVNDTKPAAAAVPMEDSKPTVSSQPVVFPPQPQQAPVPLAFVTSGMILPGSVERPVATHSSAGVVRPPQFGSYRPVNIKSSGPFNAVPNRQSTLLAGTDPVGQTMLVGDPSAMLVQNGTNGGVQACPPTAQNQGLPFGFVPSTGNTAMLIKTESQVWSGQPTGFPSAVPAQNQSSDTVNQNSANVVFALSTGASQTVSTLPQPTFALSATQRAPELQSQNPLGTNAETSPMTSTPVQLSPGQPGIFPTLQTSAWQQDTAGPAPVVAPSHFGVPSGTSSISGPSALAGAATTVSVMNIGQSAAGQNGILSVKTDAAIMMQQGQDPMSWPIREQVLFTQSENPQVGVHSGVTSPQNMASPPNVVSPSSDANTSLPTSFVWPTHQQQLPVYSTSDNAGSIAGQHTAQSSVWSVAQQQPLSSSSVVHFPQTTTHSVPVHLTNQQQSFTIDETMRILDQVDRPVNAGLQNPSLRQENVPPGSNMVLENPSNARAATNSADASSVLNSPLHPPETGLSLGFEHAFSLADTGLLSPRKSLGDTHISHAEVLQEIISDCSRGPPESEPDVLQSILSDCEPVAVRPNSFLHDETQSGSGPALTRPLQNSTPVKLLSPNDAPQGVQYGTTEQTVISDQYNFSSSAQTPAFQQATDVEMVSVRQTTSPEQCIPKQTLTMEGMAYTTAVEAGMFVNPNLIQPQVVRTNPTGPDNGVPAGVTLQSNALNSATPSFHQDVHQVPPQTAAPAADLERLETIDTSALQMTGENTAGFVQPIQQTFSAFQASGPTTLRSDQASLQ